MPYATWLVENDKFEEAQDGNVKTTYICVLLTNRIVLFYSALTQAGRQSEAANLLVNLAENAVTENRYTIHVHVITYTSSCKHWAL